MRLELLERREMLAADSFEAPLLGDAFTQGGAEANVAQSAAGSAAEGSLAVKENGNANFLRHSYISADLSDLGADLGGATLRLTPEILHGGPTSINVRVDALPGVVIDEETLTHNNAPQSGWLTGPSLSITASQQGQTLPIDVTSLVQSAIDANQTTITFRISDLDTVSNNGVNFFSDEGSGGSGPRLTLSHALPYQPGQPLVVSVPSDEDDGNYAPHDLSLREALVVAEQLAGVDTIVFDPSLAGQPVTLAHDGDDGDTLPDPLRILSEVIIAGPGAELLTIDAAGADHVFRLGADPSQSGDSNPLDLRGATLTGASSAAIGASYIGYGHSLSLDGVVITGNGAGLRLADDATISSSRIVGNSGAGVTLFRQADLTIRGTEISDNSGTGVLHQNGALTVESSTISGNDQGIAFAFGSIDVKNATISGNRGPGLNINYGHDGAVISNSTIVNNDSTGSAGGIHAGYYTAVSLHNTIVAGNTTSGTPNDVGDTASFWNGGRFSATSSHNLIQADPSGAFASVTGASNQLGADPMLAPLGDNDGPTPTHALLPGSPAIDAGDGASATGLTTDQRGFNRVVDGDPDGIASIDIGAVERVAPLIVTTASDGVNAADGVLSLREAIAATNSAVGPNPTEITFDALLTDQTITLGSELLIASDLTVDGSGAPGLAVSGNNVTRVFRVEAYAGHEVTLKDLIVEKGRVAGSGDARGAGIRASGATLTLDGVTVRDNLATSHGGGLYTVDTPLTIVGSEFSGNESAAGGGGAGFIYTAGFGSDLTQASPVWIERSTFSDNTSVNGGALEFIQFTNPGRATVDVLNSTFSGNTAPKGSAISVEREYIDVSIRNSTITDNVTAGSQGAIYKERSGSTLELVNTIVAGNIASTGATPDLFINGSHSVPDFSASNTLVGHGNDHFDPAVGTGNIELGLGVPLGLAPLVDGVHALLAGSPAIDAGDNSLATGLTTDQRGGNRIVDGDPDGVATVDIGAVEHQAPLIVNTASDSVNVADGVLSLREAIAASNNAVGPNPTEITLDASLAGQTITLDAQVVIDSDVVIDGSAAPGLTLTSSGSHRLFSVSAGAGATLRGLRIADVRSNLHGGAVHTAGDLTVERVRFVNNHTTAWNGGAIYATTGTLLIRDSEFDDNRAANWGGAIRLNGGVTNAEIHGSTFVGNQSGAVGGAVLANGSGQILISNSTFVGNHTDGTGGAVRAFGVGAMRVENSTIVDNTINSGWGTGGVSFYNANAAASFEIVNSVVAGNTRNGALEAHSGVLTNPANHNYFQTDHLLGQLDNYGGPTRTMVPLPGSPLIDAGDHALTTGILTDQLGANRGFDDPSVDGPGIVDIGAAEHSPALVVNSISNDVATTDGELTLREAINAANNAIGPNPTEITFDASLAGQTISLDAQVVIDSDVVIDGSAAPGLTLTNIGNGRRLFDIKQAANTTFRNLRMADVNTTWYGAAIATSGYLTVERVHFENNHSGNSGGAIVVWATGVLDVRDSEFVGNTARAYGGAIRLANPNADHSITGSTFENNRAIENTGGAIASHESESLNVTNSTFVRNRAGQTGASIDAYLTRALRITNATIIDNTVDSTWGTGSPTLWEADGRTITTVNSVVAGNTRNTPHSTFSNAANHNHTTEDHLLSELGDYGGPTRTMIPLPGSPLLDAGNHALAADLTTDQSGFNRGYDSPFVAGPSVVDIGAAEFSGLLAASTALEASTASVFTVTVAHDTSVDDEHLTLREALVAANRSMGPNEARIVFSPSLSGDTILLEDQGGDGIPDPLPIHSHIVIEGPGAESLTINAGGGDTHFDFSAGGPPGPILAAYDFTLEGVKLTGASGRAIDNTSVLGSTVDLVTLDRVEIAGNSGGGIFFYGRSGRGLTVIDSTVADNGGAGIYYGYGGALSVTGSTIANNDGGGVAVELAAAGLANTTISGNRRESAHPAGFHAIGYSTATLTNVTVVGNRSDALNASGSSQVTAGVYAGEAASVRLENSIVAGNWAGAAVAGETPADLGKLPYILGESQIPGFLSGSHNLIGDPNSAGGLTHDNQGNVVGRDSGGGREPLPLDEILEPLLSDNGGPTPTHALLPSSPAIDAGSTSLTTDQRGVARPLDADGSSGAQPDIGAVEYAPPRLFVSSTPGPLFDNALVAMPLTDFGLGLNVEVNSFEYTLNLGLENDSQGTILLAGGAPLSSLSKTGTRAELLAWFNGLEFQPDPTFLGVASLRVEVTDVVPANPAATLDQVDLTVEIRPLQELSYEAVADAWTNPWPTVNRSRNYGNDTTLQTLGEDEPDRFAYLRFDLTALNGVAHQASLRLHVDEATGLPTHRQFLHDVIDNGWDESLITHDLRPAIGGQLAEWTATSGEFVTLDITDHVRAALAAGRTELSFAIRSNNARLTYYSSRESGDASRIPTLLIAADTESIPPAAAPDDYQVINSGVINSIDRHDGVLANDVAAHGEVITARLDTPPQHGEFTFRNDGSFDFTPNSSYVGPDSFTYFAIGADSLETLATASLFINQRDTKTIESSADAWTHTLSVNDNEGRGVDPLISTAGDDAPDRRSYLRFEIDNTVEAVDSALFHLTVESTERNLSIRNQVYRIANNSWQEDAITWSNQPDPEDLTEDLIEQITASVAGERLSVDITDYLNEALRAGQRTISLAITSRDADRVWYHSREADDPTLRPQLELHGQFTNTPAIATLENRTAAVLENRDVSVRTHVADVLLVDEVWSVNQLSLEGDDASYFELDGNSVYLKAGVPLDHEAKPQLVAAVRVDDLELEDATEVVLPLVLSVDDVNEGATDIVLANVVSSLAEDADTSLGVFLADIQIVDDALGSNSLALSGPDAAKFEIAGAQLRLKAGTLLDHEASDELRVTIQANDAEVLGSPEVSAPFILGISDVNEGPRIELTRSLPLLRSDLDTTSPILVAEVVVHDDTLGTHNLSLADPGGPFELVGGAIYLKAGTPISGPGSLSVTVRADDPSIGSTHEDEQTLEIATVQIAENQAPSLLLNQLSNALSETTNTTYRQKVADIVLTDDGLGVNRLSLSGADAGLFVIDGHAVYLRAGVPLDATAKPTLSVTVEVDDSTLGAGADATDDLTLTVEPGGPAGLVGDRFEINDSLSQAANLGTVASRYERDLTIFSSVLRGEDAVFVIDVSGSTDDKINEDTPSLPDVVGDLNGDGRTNTYLDAQIEAFLALNDQLIARGLGNTSKVSIIAYAANWTMLDMDPTTNGVQSFTTPLAGQDADGNGIPDVGGLSNIERAFRTLRSDGGTDFKDGLTGAIEAVRASGTPFGQGNVIFLSDGDNRTNVNDGFENEVTELRATLGVNLRAFGAGPGSVIDDGDNFRDDLEDIDTQARTFDDPAELIDIFSGAGLLNDIDYYSFVAERDGVMNFVVDYDPLAGDLDLGIYDGQETLLAEAASGANSVSLAVTAGQEYFVRVDGDEMFYDLGIHLEGSLLIEETDYLKSYSETIVLGAGVEALAIDFADLSFDTTDPSFIPDAFELLLLDSTGAPVASIGGGSDAFFNLSEGAAPRLASGVVAYGEATGQSMGELSSRVTVDVTGYRAGDELTLTARLVNTDGLPGDLDTQTRVRVLPGVHQLAVAPAYESNTSYRSASFGGNTVDASRLVDVTAGFDVAYDYSSVDRSENRHLTRLTLINNGAFDVRDQLVLGIRNADAGVALLNTDGVTDDGLAFVDLSGRAWLPDDRWSRNGDRIEDVSLEIFNPSGDRFDFELVVLGSLNEAPEFTNEPRFLDEANRLVEAPIGAEFVFDAEAFDLDSDSLAFRSLVGPLLVDSETGVATWTPDLVEVSVGERVPVTLLVEDPYGAADELSFTLLVTDPPANRPPVFDTTPVITARVNTPYNWVATAYDPDGDSPLYYRLDPVIQGPAGLSIDEGTGEITWTPTADQVDQTFPVGLEVWDRETGGLKDDLDFEVRVFIEEGNHDPYFISKPGTDSDPLRGEHYVVSDATPNVDDPVTPDSINLVLEAGQTTTREVSITLPEHGASTDIIFVIDESGSMADAQEWIGQIVEQVDAQLIAAGVTDNRYGLVGFGHTDGLVRTVSDYAGADAGRELVSASTIASYIEGGGLRTSGLDEDGFEGIAHALHDFTTTETGEHPEDILRANAAKTFVLITDEGREVDRYNPADGPFTGEDSDTPNLLAELASADVTVNTIGWFSFRTGDGANNLGEFQIGDYPSGESPGLAGRWSIDQQRDAYVAEVVDGESIATSTVPFDSTLFPFASITSSRYYGQYRIVAELGVDGDYSGRDASIDAQFSAPDAYVVFDYRNENDFAWVGFSVGSPWLKAGRYNGADWGIQSSGQFDFNARTNGEFTGFEAGQTYEISFDVFGHKLRAPQVDEFFLDGNFGGSDGSLLNGLIADDRIGLGYRPDTVAVGARGVFDGFSVLGHYVDHLAWRGLPLGRVLMSHDFGSQGGSTAVGVGAPRFDGDSWVGYRPTVEVVDGAPVGTVTPGFGGQAETEWHRLYVTQGGQEYVDRGGSEMGSRRMTAPPGPYVDFAWATGGSSWDINLLRHYDYRREGQSGSAHARADDLETLERLNRESFTAGFVASQVEDTLERLTPVLRSDDPTFVGYTPVIPEGAGDDFIPTTFQVEFRGDGNPHSQFELEFARNTDVNEFNVFGTIPVTVNAPYIYELDAVDPDHDTPLSFGFVAGSETFGAVIDDQNRLVWDAQTRYQQDVPDPANPQPIEYTFELVTTDTRGGVGHQTITVTVAPPPVVNTAPEFELTDFPLADETEPSGPRLVTTVAPQVFREFRLAIPASDPEDTIRYRLVNGPEGMTINRNTGVVSWTAGPQDLGEQSFRVRLTDGKGGTSEQTFLLTVVDRDRVNHNPVFGAKPPSRVLLGETLAASITGYDINSDRFTTHLLSGPAGMALDAESGELRWTPTSDQQGSHRYVIALDDGEGGRTIETYQIEVASVTGVDFRGAPAGSIEAAFGETFFTPFIAVDRETGALAHLVQSESIIPDGFATYGRHGFGLYFTPTSLTGYAVGDTVTVSLAYAPLLGGDLSYDPVLADGATPDLSLALERRTWEFSVVEAVGDPTIARLYSVGDPTAREQLMLEIINRARSGAAGEAARLQELYNTDPDVKASMDHFGVTPASIVADFAAGVTDGLLAEAAQPLSFQGKLNEAARLHSLDMLSSGFQGHISSAGMSLDQRLAAVGYSGSSIGENVYAYGESVEHAHAAFEVEWGAGTIGHRINLHDNTFKEIGIGIVEGTNATVTPEIGPLVVTQNFASPATPTAYVTGVAFEDLDGDGFYDVGEGRGGIQVEVAGSNFYAITTASGAYSVPVSVDGSHEVTFSRAGETLGTTVATVVGLRNVKIDLELSAVLGANEAPELTLPPRTRVAAGEEFFYRPVVIDPNGDPVIDLSVVTPDWMAPHPDDPTLYVGTPGAEHVGQPFDLIVTAGDGRGGELSQTHTIEVVDEIQNVAPVIFASDAPAAVVDREYQVAFAADDVDNDTVTWTLLDAPNDSAIQFDAATGELVWTPGEEHLGEQTFVIQANDSYAPSAAHTFTVEVRGANTPARLLEVAPLGQLVAGDSFDYTLTADDPDALSGVLDFGFVQGQEIPWLHIDPTTGRITGVAPPVTGATSYTGTVYVTDGSGPTDERSLTVEVLPVGSTVNSAPELATAPVRRLVHGATYTFTPSLTDSDGGTATWTLAQESINAGIARVDDDIVWDTATLAENQTYHLTLRVVDGADPTLVTLHRFPIFLDASRATNAAPVIELGDLSALSLSPGQTFQTVVRATDSDGDRPSYRLEAPTLPGVSIDAHGRLEVTVPADAVIGSTHDVTIHARDTYGAESAPVTLAITVTADTERPQVTLFADSTAAVLDRDVRFRLAASDNVGIAEQWLTIDGGTESRTVPVDATGFAATRFSTAGEYTITAHARDAAGNLSASEPVAFRVVDPATVTHPEVTVVWSEDSGLITDTTTATFSVTHADFPEQVAWSVELISSIHGTTVLDSGVGPVTNREVTIDPFAVEDGGHVVRVVADLPAELADFGGLKPADQEYRGFTIDTNGYKVGRFATSFTDLVVPVAGVPVAFTRSYDSREINKQSDFGPGWTLETTANAEIGYGRFNVATGESTGAISNTPFSDGVRVGDEIHITLPGGSVQSFKLVPQKVHYGSGYNGQPLVVDFRWQPLGDTTSRLAIGLGDLGLDAPWEQLGTFRSHIPTQFGSPIWSNPVVDFHGRAGFIPYSPLITPSGVAIGSAGYAHQRLWSVVAPDGTRVEIDPLEDGRIEKIKTPDGSYVEIGHQDVTSYDADGRVLSRSIVGRDGLGRVRGIVRLDDPLGGQPTLNSAGQVTNGESVVYSYDAAGDLTSVQQIDGSITTLEYDVADSNGDGVDEVIGHPHFLTRVNDATGVRQYEARFNEAGQFIGVVDASGELAAVEHLERVGPDGEKLRVDRATDAVGNPTEVAFDSRGRVVRTLTRLSDAGTPAVEDDLYQVTLAEYDAFDNLVGSSHPFQRTFAYAYAGQTDLNAITDSALRDLQGDEPVYSEADKTTYAAWALRAEYDSSGNVLFQQDGLGNVTRYLDYDDFGQPGTVIDPEGNRTVSEYDNAGSLLLTRVLDLDQTILSETHYEYDERFGQVSRVVQIDALGNEVETGRTAYDASGRPVRSTDADGVTSYTVYDGDGRATLSFNYWRPDAPEGKLLVSRSYYDEAGRVTRSRSYTLDASQFPVDGDGLSALTDPAQLDALPFESESSTEYDAAGRALRSTDRHGRVSETRYNARGQVVESRTPVVDEDGNDLVRVSRTFYDRLGRSVASNDPFFLDATTGTLVTPLADLRLSFTVYDAAGRAVEQKRLEGAQALIEVAPSTRYGQQGLFESTFAGEDWAATVTDGQAGFRSSTQTVYRADGRVLKTISATGVESYPEYDRAGRQVGTLTAVDLDQDGVVEASDTDGDGVIDSGSELIRTYGELDQAGRRVVSFDADGVPVRLIYDAQGRVVETIFVDETTTRSEYDALGRMTAQVNQLGERREFEHDHAGRQTAVLLPAIELEVESIEDVDSLVEDTPSFGFGYFETITVRPRYEYGYDEYGNHVSITTNAFQTEDGRVVYLRKAGNGLDEVVATRVVGSGQSAVGSLADATTTTLAYDHYGRQVSRTLPAGITERSVYDDRSLSDIAASNMPLGTSVGLGQREYAVDFEGRVTAYRYDNTSTGGGRVVAMHYYASEQEYLADRADGVLDGSRERTETTYDEYGRVIEVTTQREDDAAPRVTTTAYDAEGRPTWIASPEGTLNYEYDLLGRHVRTYTGGDDTARASVAGDGAAVTDTRYGYDALGRLQTVTVVERFDQPLATPEVTTNFYDKNGRLDAVVTPGGVVTDYEYDAQSRLDVETVFHDADGDRVYEAAVDTLLASFDYEVREDGKRTGVTEVNDLGETRRFDWAYDPLGRLVEERYDGPGEADDYVDTFAFDVASNRVERTRETAAETTATTSRYDANDRILNSTTDSTDDTQDRFTVYEFDGTTQVGQTVYRGLDENGPVAERRTMEFNLQGRQATTTVTAYEEDGVTIASQDDYSYKYDESGIRVSQTVNGQTTVYLVDLQNHTGYAQVLEERVDGVLTRTYILGHDVLGQATADAVHYFLMDGHGSTRALYDLAALLANPDNPAAAILQRFAYDAYGALIQGASLTAVLAEAQTNHLYSGEQTDLNGSQYLRARYYDISSGRFNRLDPFFGNLSDPLSFHKYAYVHGDPIGGIDPKGESIQLVGALYAAAFAAAGDPIAHGGTLEQAAFAFGLTMTIGSLAVAGALAFPVAAAAIATSPILWGLGVGLLAWGVYDSFVTQGNPVGGAYRVATGALGFRMVQAAIGKAAGRVGGSLGRLGMTWRPLPGGKPPISRSRPNTCVADAFETATECSLHDDIIAGLRDDGPSVALYKAELKGWAADNDLITSSGTFSEGLSSGRPFTWAIRTGPGKGHAITVFGKSPEIGDDMVRVFDPELGEGFMSATQLQERAVEGAYSGVALWFHRG